MTRYLHKIFLVTILILLFSMPLFSISLTGKGYGSTAVNAKADALQDLASKIYVNVKTLITTQVNDTNSGYEQFFNKTINLESNITFENVRYVQIAKSKTKEDKANGDFYCIVEITDKDKQICIEQAKALTEHINSIYQKIQNEKDLRSLDAYYTVLEECLNRYSSYYLTAKVLQYSDELPMFSNKINSTDISIEHKKIQEKILLNSMSGSKNGSSSVTDLLINSLWADIYASTSNSTVSTYSEGFYSKRYKIGDFGPAGGIVFYDKGKYSDGWRFLEIALEDIPGTYTFAKTGRIDTSSSIGSGKSNTEKIIAHDSKDTSNAAYVCSIYNEGGYTDWYLPSKEELELVYNNLRNNDNLSIVKTGYWSSTQLNSSFAYGFSFKTKKTFTDTSTKKYSVRAIRSF